MNHDASLTSALLTCIGLWVTSPGVQKALPTSLSSPLPTCPSASSPSWAGTLSCLTRSYGPGTTKANPRVGLSRSVPSMSSQDTAEHQDSPHRPHSILQLSPCGNWISPASASVSKYHRGPQGTSRGPVAGGDLAAHCLGNSPCLRSAVPGDAAALCERWVCICTAPFARGISVNAANVTYLCEGCTRQSHHPTSATHQVLRDGITRGMVEKRHMHLPRLEFSQYVGKTTALLKLPRKF